MPIYEFRCARCGELSEVVQRVGERPPPCPKCGSKRMARAVSRTSFQLKGGGWYADLYASKKEKPAPGAKPGAGGGEAGAEKPAAAAAPAAPAATPSSPPTGGGGDAPKGA
jgi:putative FmdB family regulatory protein